MMCLYGITMNIYNEMLEKQDGACAICKKPETYKHHASKRVISLSVDHCHDTGRVRGLLCRNCNRYIGLFGDDCNLLEEAIKYLRNN